MNERDWLWNYPFTNSSARSCVSSRVSFSCKQKIKLQWRKLFHLTMVRDQRDSMSWRALSQSQSWWWYYKVSGKWRNPIMITYRGLNFSETFRFTNSSTFVLHRMCTFQRNQNVYTIIKINNTKAHCIQLNPISFSTMIEGIMWSHLCDELKRLHCIVLGIFRVRDKNACNFIKFLAGIAIEIATLLGKP